MIDRKALGNEQTKDNLALRHYVIDDALFSDLAIEKAILQKIEEINVKINKNIHTLEDKELLKSLKFDYDDIKDSNTNQLAYIPNILHETVPYGVSESDNVVVYESHTPEQIKELFPNKSSHHIDIAKDTGLNQSLGVAMAKSRFSVLQKDIANLHNDLVNAAINAYRDLDYELQYVPLLVNREALYGTGQIPKFEDDLFKTEDGLYLIPTGEVPLTNIIKDKIYKENEVEQLLMTHTPCFRKEAGAAGKDTRGLIRQHQFDKVELVRICLPEHGLETLNILLKDVEGFISKFYMPYRIVELCSGDIGFSGHKAYDIEMWFNHEQRFREIASITWCGDFQARRLNAKVNRNGKKEYVHTLNATGLAVGRVLAAIIESEKIS